ncbi:MAG: hypothetical protein ACREJ3_17045, partial [Polyangiaceae bacterium]
DAVVWLRRAAQSAGDAEDDDRALTLARDAAELAEWLEQNAALPAKEPAVPTAAQVHAGMLDPWAEGDASAGKEGSAKPDAPSNSVFQEEEVVTSAPPAKPTAVAAGLDEDGLDLSTVEALVDLPDDARAAFGRAARIEDLARESEVSGFALALILEGTADLSATIVDSSAQELREGAILRARGTIEVAAPIRLVATSERARIATWDEDAVADAFRACPWVEDELRGAGDRLQALVGVTMGPLGERLDPVLRAVVTSRLSLRVLAEHEVCASRGAPVPGLVVVGAGELEVLADDGAPSGKVLGAGDFLFASEVLSAAPAPHSVRAAKGGALVLHAERGLAQELLVTYPPLLEIIAGE